MSALEVPGQLLLAASGVERICAAAESKRQRTADYHHILHEVLEWPRRADVLPPRLLTRFDSLTNSARLVP